jgi:hypothetical protein
VRGKVVGSATFPRPSGFLVGDGDKSGQSCPGPRFCFKPRTKPPLLKQYSMRPASVSPILFGEKFDGDRITALAAAVAPMLTLHRGPKVSSSSAHEFLLKEWPVISVRRPPIARRTHSQEYVDALTEATRREFRNLSFDSRPARRRVKAQREAAQG